MQIFSYRVKDQSGKTLKGLIEALDEKQAVAALRERGYFLLSVAKKQEFNLSALFKVFQRAKFSDVVEFTRQLSTMMTAGLPLTEAIVILQRQSRNVEMARVLDDVLDQVQGGASLADALSVHPRLFSKVYIALVRAGESAGVLDRVLARLADNLEKDREFRGKTKGALIYPTIIVIGMMVVIFIMMILVVPKLTALYKDFGTQLPLPTRVLMGVSEFFVNFSPFVIPMVIGLYFAYQAWVKTPQGRLKVDKFIFSIPVWGKLKKGVALTEFTRTLGLLIGAGIPILDALHIVSEAVGNRVYQDGIEAAAKEVERGFPLGVPISRDPNFPPIVGQMLKVGEESGKMDEVLGKLSVFFETETELLIRGLTTAIEPIIMIILGVGVGFLVFAVILPIYNLTSQF